MYRKIAPFAEKNEKKMDNLFISKYKNITKFIVEEPSLNEIFIDYVGGYHE